MGARRRRVGGCREERAEDAIRRLARCPPAYYGSLLQPRQSTFNHPPFPTPPPPPPHLRHSLSSRASLPHFLPTAAEVLTPHRRAVCFFTYTHTRSYHPLPTDSAPTCSSLCTRELFFPCGLLDPVQTCLQPASQSLSQSVVDGVAAGGSAAVAAAAAVVAEKVPTVFTAVPVMGGARGVGEGG